MTVETSLIIAGVLVFGKRMVKDEEVTGKMILGFSLVAFFLVVLRQMNGNIGDRMAWLVMLYPVYEYAPLLAKEAGLTK